MANIFVTLIKFSKLFDDNNCIKENIKKDKNYMDSTNVPFHI